MREGRPLTSDAPGGSALREAAHAAGPLGCAGTFLPRGFVFALLFGFFAAAYLLCPYWMLPASVAMRLVLVGATVGLGLLWAWSAAGNVRLGARRAPLAWLLPIGIFLLVLYWKPLIADVPWRGDEDYHIQNTDRVADFIAARGAGAAAGLAAATVAFLAVAWWIGRRRVAWAATLCIGLGAVLVACVLAARPVVPGLHRYPYISKLFSALPVLLARAVVGRPVPEAFYRVVPLFSTALLAWFLATRLRGSGRLERVLSLVLVALTPLIAYYASILYLEMPAVLLMTVVCFDLHALLTGAPRDLPTRPAWYALVLVGFIKEATAPFLATFVALRCFAQWQSDGRRRGAARVLAAEVPVALSVLTPLAVYLFYRLGFRSGHEPFEPSATGAAALRFHVALLRSYAEQFGPVLALFLVGVASLASRGRRLEAGFLLWAWAAHVLFFLTTVDPRYSGYSRFNLFLAPLVFFGAWAGLEAIGRRHRRAMATALGVSVVAAALLWPIRADGVRRSGWGDSERSTSERYYPYRKAARWLNAHAHGRRVLHAGLTHSYPLGFYLSPSVRHSMLLHPANTTERQRLEQALDAASRGGYDIILYHPASAAPPEPGGRFVVRMTFRNSEHALYVLERDGAP